MSACVNLTELSNWIPVIGTLLGAVTGLGGGLLISRQTNKYKIIFEKENRERIRIESLYETLTEIRKDYQGSLGNMISKVHYDSANASKNEHSGTPPLVKLDMLLHMYFPSLTEPHKQFIAAKEHFGNKMAENLTTSYSEKTLEEKQKVCGEYVKLFSALDNEISNLQQKLVNIVKA